MRRLSIAILLSTLLLVSICSAQQTSTTAPAKSPVGIDGPIIGGDGTTNYIAIWATPNYLLSSVIYQSTAGNVGVGTTSPAAKLDVNGNVNAATTYGIGGSTVLTIASPADANLFTGVGAGVNNVAGSGLGNVFSGYDAGYSNTTGSDNVFLGSAAGELNTTGSDNVFLGPLAGQRNTTGSGNVFSGIQAGENNTSGYDNAFTGNMAGFSNTTGFGNTFFGYDAGAGNTTGEFNTFFGFGAGAYNTTGSNDVYIANVGPSSGAESNTIRIGTQGTGNGQQNITYIAGIFGSTSSSGIQVYINSNGQLGTQTSSLRFKEQVRDMGDSTSALMKLRPVMFLYKPEYAEGERTLQYGLIAEEVAKVYPELVAYDSDGQPYSVRYQYLSTMLLNEVQKQYRRAEQQSEIVASQQAQIKTQEQEIENLKLQLQQQNAAVLERLLRLEKLAGTQTVAQK